MEVVPQGRVIGRVHFLNSESDASHSGLTFTGVSEAIRRSIAAKRSGDELENDFGLFFTSSPPSGLGSPHDESETPRAPDPLCSLHAWGEGVAKKLYPPSTRRSPQERLPSTTGPAPWSLSCEPVASSWRPHDDHAPQEPGWNLAATLPEPTQSASSHSLEPCVSSQLVPRQ